MLQIIRMTVDGTEEYASVLQQELPESPQSARVETEIV